MPAFSPTEFIVTEMYDAIISLFNKLDGEDNNIFTVSNLEYKVFTILMDIFELSGIPTGDGADFILGCDNFNSLIMGLPIPLDELYDRILVHENLMERIIGVGVDSPIFHNRIIKPIELKNKFKFDF